MENQHRDYWRAVCLEIELIGIYRLARRVENLLQENGVPCVVGFTMAHSLDKVTMGTYKKYINMFTICNKRKETIHPFKVYIRVEFIDRNNNLDVIRKLIPADFFDSESEDEESDPPSLWQNHIWYGYLKGGWPRLHTHKVYL